MASPHPSPYHPLQPYQLRALAGAVVCAALYWFHAARQPVAAPGLDDTDSAAPDARTSQQLLALVQFFALLARSGQPLAADAPYPERRLAVTRQALEEASFLVFQQQRRAFPDNFFRHVDGHREDPLASSLPAEIPPQATSSPDPAPSAPDPDGQALLGLPGRFAEAVQQLVAVATERGAHLLYHDAFPARFRTQVANQRLFAVVPWLSEYCVHADLHQAADFAYLADILDEATAQQPPQAYLFQRGVQWLRTQEQRAAVPPLAVPPLRWTGPTADLLEIGYALVDARFITSAASDPSGANGTRRDELVTAFAHLWGKTVVNPRQRLAKRRTRVPAAVYPAIEQLVAVSLANRRPVDDWPPKSPSEGHGGWRAEDLAFWRAEIRTLVVEMYGQPSPAPLPVAPAAVAAAGEELLTVAQVGQRLDVCRQTVHEWVRRGLLTAHKIGRRTYILHTDLMACPRRLERSLKPAKAAAPRSTSSRPVSRRSTR
jgi:excisionase family DNA binding protein